MGDRVAVDVGRLEEVSSTCGEEAEAALLMGMVECRICQEEDLAMNLESPCACCGSLKYAHRQCVQRWCNEKGDTTCEICHESYMPGYTAPPRVHSAETIIEISGGWSIAGNHLDVHDPRILTMAAAQRHFLEDEYNEYTSTNNNAASFCRSIFLILMALLLLRHTLTITDNADEDDASAIFSLFLLRAAGFLLPCYIMAWAISIMQCHRQTQEEAAQLPTSLALILHGSRRRTMQFTQPPDSPTSPHPEPHQ